MQPGDVFLHLSCKGCGLLHFLQAASEHKIEVSLIATPDMGIHFPGCGLPKDLMQDKELYQDVISVFETHETVNLSR